MEERRGLGGGAVLDIGSEAGPVLTPYGMRAYREDGFWWLEEYSMTGSGEKEWRRVGLSTPETQDLFDKGSVRP